MRINEIDQIGVSRASTRHGTGSAYTNLQLLGALPLNPVDSFSSFLKIVERDCSEILKVYRALNGNKFLYRGIESDPKSPYVYSKPKINRKPKDMNQTVHYNIERILKYLKIKATRDNSIFTSTVLDKAATYGSPYLIFPIDGFNFSWSKRAVDLYSYVNNSQGLTDFMMDPNFTQREDNIQWVQKEYFQFTDKDLLAAMDTRGEILINGQYYGVRLSYLRIEVPNSQYILSEFLLGK